ncbi:MAG: glycosyl hydrolase, partial [Chloroflexota bacterium]|nr:glycosyl hydrolase [Chloroflexota bacterium]
AVRSDDTNIIYAGSYQGYISRYDCRTGQRRDISVWPELMIGWPAKDVRERFQWTFPIHLSPHDPNILYVGGAHVLRSTDEGASWQTISPDLTRNDPSRLEDSGGVVTLDNCGTEYYGTVFAFAESPCQRGLLWAGSDDGLVHMSRDDGQRWDNVTPAALPEWALISVIAPSPHDPAVAYLAANRYKLDDFAPYLFKTDDYGRHWVAITNGLPADVFARVIREDPARRGLLYAGTETGVYVSFDDGLNWQPLQFNLPVVPIHDLEVKGDDLIAATHGRSFWVMDDLSVVRQWSDVPRDGAIHLFSPRTTVKFAGSGGFDSPPGAGVNFTHTGVGYVAYREVAQAGGEKRRVFLDCGQNPPDGVAISYLLRAKPEGEATLTFLDASGREIKRFTSEERKTRRARAGDLKLITGVEVRTRDEPRVAIEAGLNRFTWDMRYPDGEWVDGYVTDSGILSGPVAAPGHYQARLTVGDQSQTVTFEIAKDPRINATQEELDAQFTLLCQIRDKVSEIHQAINQLTSIRQQLSEWTDRARELKAPNHEELARQTAALSEQLGAIEGALIETRAAEDDDTLRFPVKLNVKLAALMSVVASADAAPTRQAREVFAALCAQADSQLARLRALRDGELAAINTLIREANLPAVMASAQAPNNAKERPTTSKG